MGRAIARLPEEHRYYVELAGIVLQFRKADFSLLREELDRLDQRFRENGRDYTANPYFEEVRHYLAELEGWRCNQEGQFERCLQLADEILIRQPNSYTMLLRGCALIGLKRYGEAEEQLRNALGQHPVAAWAHIQMAVALMSQSRLAEAEAELLRGLPAYATAELPARYYLDILSSIWRREDPVQDKTAIMDMLLSKLPGNPEVRVLDARLRRIDGDPDGAVGSLRMAA